MEDETREFDGCNEGGGEDRVYVEDDGEGDNEEGTMGEWVRGWSRSD